MRKILLIKSWNHPDILRQTPRNSGIWGDNQFFSENNGFFDYVVALTLPKKDITVKTYKENIWFFQQEPPNEYFYNLHKVNEVFNRVYTSNKNISSDRFITSQPSIGWFIDKSYDELINCEAPHKSNLISCVTSFKSDFIGHKRRIDFINKLIKSLDFDLIATHDYYERKYGKSREKEISAEISRYPYNKVVLDKWTALAPYKYSIVIENFRGPDYWSEKLADCLLAYTMPIYYGATNIDRYFPEGAVIKIDIRNPDAVEQIRRILKMDPWSSRIQIIKNARKKILNEYQLFPQISEYIKNWELKVQPDDLTSGSYIIRKSGGFAVSLKTGLLSRILKIKTALSDDAKV